ncbi:MAG: hypothetical protein ACHQYQ_10185 [Bacteriovoracales bacterium]
MKIFKAILACSIISFLWSGFSHMVLPWHNINMKSFSVGGTLVTAAIKAEAQSAGFYVLPNMDMEMHKSKEAQEKWQADALKGPTAFLSVRPEGSSFSMGLNLLVQFINQLIVSILVVLLCLKTNVKGILGYACFVSVIVTAGEITAVVPLWNWWGFPLSSTLISIVDTSINWFLAGLGVGKVLSKT